MRNEFLAEASAVLASSLDYEVTLAAVRASPFRKSRTGASSISRGATAR